MTVRLRRPLRFGLTGILNTLVGLGVIFAAKAFLRWDDVPANVAGYGAGLVVSFFVNRAWTFAHTGSMGPAALRFALSFAVAYGANLATVLALRDIASVDGYIAQAAGVVPYTVTFYLLSSRYVFAAKR